MNAKPPFEDLVRAHGATVLRVCRATLAGADADDAWQETFLSALRAYTDLPDGANHEAWLVTIAHRKAIDAHRARARRAVPVTQVPEPAPAADRADGADLRAALDRLSQNQRTAVVLHHVAGLPYAEIAVATGGTPTAARRAASDGMAALRRMLTEGDAR